ncbi:expressed unknown protein [Seminavis robusta]|uniref:CRAL-TRIO domain-containing protein n=1 Tax=Seminavis robusta TaxID=568900 RepID=A0A9N8E8Y6_9STRA|nr:expressed unknown protein [Seminavis robusta]|eukprot:Sro679_g186080.1 n/a (314) ;mRNA; f:27785-29024
MDDLSARNRDGQQLLETGQEQEEEEDLGVAVVQHVGPNDVHEADGGNDEEASSHNEREEGTGQDQEAEEDPGVAVVQHGGHNDVHAAEAGNDEEASDHNDREEDHDPPLAPQALKEEYGILDTIEQARRSIGICAEDYFPGFLLHFGLDEQMETSMIVYDFAKGDKQVFRCRDKVGNCICCGYYVSHAKFSNLQFVRKGNIHIMECSGYDFSLNMFDIQIMKKLTIEVCGSYPSTFLQCFLYHTPLAFNVLASMIRRSLPDNLKSKFNVGYTFSGRLDEFYGLPTPEAASRRAVDNLCEALQVRYENERTFSL